MPSRRSRSAASFRPALLRLEERAVPSASIVKGVNTNPAAAFPHDLTAVGNKLFFADSNPAAKAEYLWVTDGTPGGTTPLKPLATDPNTMAAFNGRVYYVQQSNTLWTSDGTAAGTVPLKTFTQVLGLEYAVANGALYFDADDGVHGSELWKTDGTAAGTVLVKDVNPGTASSAPSSLTAVGNTLYFLAFNGTSHG